MAKPAFSLKVEGIKDLEGALSDLGKRLGKATLTRSLRKAAAPMLQLAKDLAPGDEDNAGIAGSIKLLEVTVNDPGKRAYSRVMKETWVKGVGSDTIAALSAKRDAYRAEGGAVTELAMGPDLTEDGGRVAHLAEFGTAPHINAGQRPGTEHPGTAPQPFIRPAFDIEGPKTIGRLKPILAAEIDKSERRAAARAAKKAAKG